MDRVSILRLVSELRRRHGELEGVEAKAAHTGTPADLFKPLSAFANRAGGGILLFGLDEDVGFKVVGVGNPRKLQEDISGLAAQMEPPLRPSFSVEEIEGATVVAVEIPEVAYDQKPCYHRPHHLQEGSFIRVGNSTRRMSDYEIYSFISSRTQPKFDAEPILEATLEDLDRGKLEEYLAQQRKARPSAPYWSLPFEQILSQLRIVIETDGILRPTLAGLLMFGSYPQRFEQQMVVVFLQFYGTTTTEEAPSGERFLDNRKFEGTVKEIIDNATDYVMAGMRKGSLIRGVTRQDIPEYPEVALKQGIPPGPGDGDGIFLMKDLAAVEEAVDLGAKIFEGVPPSPALSGNAFGPARCLPAPCKRRRGRTRSAGPWGRPRRSGAGSREPAGCRPPGRGSRPGS